MKEIFARLKNMWIVLTNHDANLLIEMSYQILIRAAKNNEAEGNVKIIRTNGNAEEYTYTVKRVEPIIPTSDK